MAYTTGPYAECQCLQCKRMIQVQISAKTAERDLDDLRSNDFLCAECSAERDRPKPDPLTGIQPGRIQIV
jgi:hypothetical protein